MTYEPSRALELLRLGVNRGDALFREGQEQAIEHAVEGRGRLLVVQKTGWGKSFVYFIAAKMLREQGLGPALLVSPLLSLMRNQVEAAQRMGVRAHAIHSANTDEWAGIESAVQADDVDVLLISPERLANERFRKQVLSGIAARIALLVIDEAHCISDWGHDFRPHYRLIERVVRALPSNLRVLATTATANERVLQDLRQVLGPDLHVSRGDLSRPSLTLQTIRLPSQAERLAWIAGCLPRIEGSGIIYTLTVRDAGFVANWLKAKGFNVEAYTGQSGSHRVSLEQALLDNELKALVATTALGMGYDKPDLAFVIHYQTPGSVVHYYQQVGRAGRALDSAYGVLLSGEEETEITDWFISSAFPTPREVEAVLGALDQAPGGLSVPELLARVNISKGRIQKTIDLLSLESPAPIAKQGKRWQLTAAELDDSFWDRAERLTELRKEEQRQMADYVALPFGEHMAFLVDALDGDSRTLQAPTLPPLPTGVEADLLGEALTFLRRTNVVIEPRKQWPPGGMPRYRVQGSIPEGQRAMSGRALSRWGDAGWGQLVRQGKYDDGRFSDELVEACLSMIGEWSPVPAPIWVTAIPSLRHPRLVPDFAQRLAARMGLPFCSVLTKSEERPEQKAMANSTQQARNVDGALAITGDSLPTGPVLLVDDIVDSRWTITVAAWLLRSRGCDAVLPLVLAEAGHQE